jgi:hypothetical protein
MRQRYLDLRDSHLKHARKSFWMDRDALSKMVNLLEAELKKDQSAKPPTDPDKLSNLTDGIRIYLGVDLSSSGPQLDLQLLFVSTKDNGQDLSNSQSGRCHKDNYIHDTKHPLFGLSGFVVPCFGNCPGALLYQKNEDPNHCDVKPPHSIKTSVAEEMVDEFVKDHLIVTEGEWFDLGLWQMFNKIPGISGVRIYLARHTSTSNPSMMDAFLLTTTKLIGNDHVDDFSCHDDILEEYKKLYESKYGPRLLTQDNGELCPTHCD